MVQDSELSIEGDRITYVNDPTAQYFAEIPTKRNPDVLVTIGRTPDGKFVPMKLSYPGSYDKELIKNKIERFKAKDGCELCDRFENEYKQSRTIRRYKDQRFPIISMVMEQRPSLLRLLSNLK